MSIPFERYFGLLGRFVHSWSMFERQLDISVAVTWHHCDGNGLGQSYPRTQLRRKLQFLKIAISSLPGLSEHAERISLIVERCEDLVGFRDMIIHGTADAIDDDKASLNRLVIDRIGDIRNEPVIILWHTFEAHCIAVEEVATFALRLSEELLSMSARMASANLSPKSR